MREVPNKAVDFIAGFEGLELKAYKDIVGVVTIGYGHTGPDVAMGQVITKAEAKKLLKDDLKDAVRKIYSCVKPAMIEKLNDNQWSALISFAFNLGANKSWTIWKVINAGNFDAVPSQLMRFVNAGGKKVRGLVRRRSAEAEMWNDDAEDVVLVSRLVSTPPTPSGEKPLAASKTLWTAAASTAATASAGIMQVQQAIAPQAEHSEYIGNAIGALAIIASVLTVAIMIFRWFDHRKDKN